MACVYWIHLPEHTDVLTEGYVGFTKHSAASRWTRHRRDLTKGARSCRGLAAAMDEHGLGALQMRPLVVGGLEYCVDLEARLRPYAHTGWNIGPGGQSPVLGRKHSPEALAKINAHKAGRVVSPETRAKIAATLKGNSNAKGAVRTPEMRSVYSERGRRFRHTEEAKARIGAASRVHKLAYWARKRAENDS